MMGFPNLIEQQKGTCMVAPPPPKEMPTNEKRTPANCPLCEYDRRFPGFEAGGWMQQDNNGPIVSCPLCNPDGKWMAVVE